MIHKRLFITLLFIGLAISIFSQGRVGSCRSANIYDRFYLTPYVGFGRANVKSDSLQLKTNSWVAGIKAHYQFNAFRLGLGAHYQSYSKPNFEFLKPYISFEYPIYFDEFNDFGFYIQAGPSLNMNDEPLSNGGFADIGLFYNLVINSSSGLYIATDYSFNQYNYKLGYTSQPLKIGEIKLIIGYRIWF